MQFCLEFPSVLIHSFSRGTAKKVPQNPLRNSKDDCATAPTLLSPLLRAGPGSVTSRGRERGRADLLRSINYFWALPRMQKPQKFLFSRDV